MYRRAIYPVLQRFDAEHTHETVLRLLSVVERLSPAQQLLRRLVAYNDPRLDVDLWGLHFANPLGIAAGLDKNAVAVRTWGALGFGHVEVGTVTPLPQPGNPRPRVFRLPADRALINRMGFPGQGAAAVGRRLRRSTGNRPIVGVNIGANKTSVEAGRAVEDYIQALTQLYEDADYLTINISSPNTARLRELQGRAALESLVQQVVAQRDQMPVRKPLLIKIAPDLTPADLDDISAVCLASGVDGIIATNTTIDRPVSLREAAKTETGGLSGAPLRERSTDVIRYLYASTQGRLPIIGVGGVFSADDAFAKLAAGAALVQVY
ncbi:MAG: quinone-dependent dihydroorotate dehydrogenase, partial [Chloroflexi bacterium]|nr:quinone-dependent dihydroorotate dehydrogenase [Chloroflexota bacterium]